MSAIVALDIETTGLDPEKEAIIEIGVCRFNGSRIENEWKTLVNPGRHIPEFITNLTGITDEMVRQAPRLRDVLNELSAFISDLPILGHNIQFDLSFFKRYGLFVLNERIDTYEMAAVLMPSASRYNLGALGRALGIPLPGSHRALDDARLTHAVFHRLFAEAKALPLDLLAEIVRLGEPIEWDGNWAFQQVLRARSKEKVTARKVSQHVNGPLFKSEEEKQKFPSIQLPESCQPIDPDEAAAYLDYGGAFSQHFPNYEHRPEQIEMLRAVAESLSTSQHLLVEAGTGVGKSFAYLVPAALFALQNNTRLVVSTNTINLQDQLMKKDIPDLRVALGMDLRAAVLKGRANYLCPRRLEYLRTHGPRTADEMRILAKVLVWSLTNNNGDRTEINLTGPAERDVWLHISAEDDACTTETCLERTGGACPFFHARLAAENAHLLIVNHALLLSDVAAGNKVLPEYHNLIVDEGHHLEGATTNALSFRLTQLDLERLLRELGGTNSGILGSLISSTRNVLSPSDFASFDQMVTRATDLAFRLENQARAFFQAVHEFVENQREGQPVSQYTYQQRILPATHTLPGWDELELAWDGADNSLRLLLNLLADLQKAAGPLYSGGLENLEDLISSLGGLFRRMNEAERMVSQMIFEPSEAYVYWVDVNPNNNRLALNAAPIRIGPLVEEHLWHEKKCIILTSATLTTASQEDHHDFSYLRNTLNADEADGLAFGSPFDYENAALVYIANDVAEPNTPEHQSHVDHALINLCIASGGRTLVLFTSYAQLKRTSRAISNPLAKHDIIVYEQGEGASPNTLLESFRSTERAVLFGTRSFWEGVDVPGEALSVLVIVKLPFAVPTDPLVAARSEIYDDPFYEYQLPEAVLRFRQGFGRLIRTKSDRGVVVILDRRVLTKKYGRTFLDSLPQCTMRSGPLGELPNEAARWLNL